MSYLLILYMWGSQPITQEFPLQVQCDNAIVQMRNALAQGGASQNHMYAICVPKGNR